MLKNLLLIFVALLSLYLYMHPRTETQVVTRTAAPVMVRVPAPTPASKLYYHSPLDASAMSTSASTGTGYFSTDTTSRFSSGSYYGPTYYGSYPAAGGYPVYYPGGSSSVSNTVIYNANPGARASSLPTPRPSFLAGRLPTN